MVETTLDLVRLEDCPNILPDCARWLYDEWGKAKVDAFEGTLAGLREVAASDQETGLVAFSDGRPVGMALLVACDLNARRDLTPWLSSLLVLPDYRGRQIASRLVDGIASIARERRHERLFLFSRSAVGLYRARGWVVDGQVRKDGKTYALMSLAL